MLLTYTDIFGDGKEHTIKAEVTTAHSASHYGIPVVVLDNGDAVGLQSWLMLGYRIQKASVEEMKLMEKVFDNFNSMMAGANFDKDSKGG